VIVIVLVLVSQFCSPQLSNACARAQVSLADGFGHAVDTACLRDRDGGGQADAMAAGHEHWPYAAARCASQRLQEGRVRRAGQGGVGSSGSTCCE
jgi:hypothetical protein